MKSNPQFDRQPSTKKPSAIEPRSATQSTVDNQAQACDALLRWLSHRGQVSESLFKAAAKSLCENHWDIIGPLERLGHIEYLPGTQRWQATPPLLLIRSGLRSTLVLGARSQRLWETLIDENLTSYNHLLSTEHHKTIPTCEKPTASQIERLQAIGWRISPERGLDWLKSLPTLWDDWGQRTDSPPATAVEHFNGQQWNPCSTKQDGLYRPVSGRRDLWLKVGPKIAWYVSREEKMLAKYLWRTRNKRVSIVWNKEEMELTVPPWRLPLLIERPMIAQSGSLPEMRSRRLIFKYVKRDFAIEFARIVCMKLDIK